MAQKCPSCGFSVEDDPKYCPSCGAVMSAHTVELPKTTLYEDEPHERRVFVPRNKRYGDTDQYAETTAKTVEKPEPEKEQKNNLSIYLSIISIVLSVVAIAMVIIFVLIPSNSPENTNELSPSASTTAPTQPPTDPPITGDYTLSEIKGGSLGFYNLMLSNSHLQMQPDYTGTVTLGNRTLGNVSLDRESGTAKILGVDGAFTFDGKVLALSYRNLTLVYKKD